MFSEDAAILVTVVMAANPFLEIVLFYMCPYSYYPFQLDSIFLAVFLIFIEEIDAIQR